MIDNMDEIWLLDIINKLLVKLKRLKLTILKRLKFTEQLESTTNAYRMIILKIIYLYV